MSVNSSPLKRCEVVVIAANTQSIIIGIVAMEAEQFNVSKDMKTPAVDGTERHDLLLLSTAHRVSVF